MLFTYSVLYLSLLLYFIVLYTHAGIEICRLETNKIKNIKRCCCAAACEGIFVVVVIFIVVGDERKGDLA